jgi:hypothetical protein
MIMLKMHTLQLPWLFSFQSYRNADYLPTRAHNFYIFELSGLLLRSRDSFNAKLINRWALFWNFTQGVKVSLVP